MQKAEAHENSRPQIISINSFLKTIFNTELAEIRNNRIRPTEISDMENTSKHF